MQWEVIAAVAEVVSAIAVVISLIYVGLQIRQSNALARANTVHQINSSYTDVFSQITADAELAHIYYKAINDIELDAVELIRYSTFLISYFGFMEDAYFQEASGLSPFELGAADFVAFLAPQTMRLLKSSQARTWWLTEGREIYAPDFFNKVCALAGLRAELEE